MLGGKILKIASKMLLVVGQGILAVESLSIDLMVLNGMLIGSMTR